MLAPGSAEVNPTVDRRRAKSKTVGGKKNRRFSDEANGRATQFVVC